MGNMRSVRDDIAESVVMDDLLGSINDVRVVHGNNLLCAGLSAEHGQNAGSTANIENDLVLEDILVLVHEIAV
jgi:hypothetical protein